MADTCTWIQQDDGCDYWESSCGGAFSFNDDGPTANEMKFCCYCGKSLIEEFWKPPEENDDET